jgi:hypothetical protein
LFGSSIIHVKVKLISVKTDDLFCKKPLVESYGFFSYTSPAREKMILCPSVKATCCPAYEQFKVFKHYNTVVKPYFKVFEQVISKSLELLQKRIKGFFDLNIPEKISKMKSKSKKLLMGDKFNKINRQAQIMEVLTKMQERLPTTLEYMDHLKSLFFCTICGYGNQQFIDIETKSINFSSDSCDSLVRNTFQFSYLLNNLLVPFLLEVSEFMVKAMKDKNHKVLKLKPLGLINKAVDDCAKDYKDADEALNNCLAYCSFFKLNRNTPEIEGYPELFFNFLVQVDVFIATKGTIKEKAAPASNAPKAPEKTTDKKADEKKEEEKKGKLRLLEELLGGDEYINLKYRILEASEEGGEGEEGGDKNADPKAKKPGQDFVDEFDPVNIMIQKQKGNIFSHEGIDSNFDDSAMAQALEVQECLNGNRSDGFDQIIRHYFAVSFQPEMDDIDGEEIFSRPVNEKVHLDHFRSKFGFTGINFTHEMKHVNWNLSQHALVASLKGSKENGPTDDHLDLKVVELANSVSNAYLIGFHRDNFLEFDGTHLHQPNNIIQSLKQHIDDKASQHYAKVTTGAINLMENVGGEGAADMFKATLKATEEKFAYKVATNMARINKRLENADLTQLKEIEDRIAGATLEQLIELQEDINKLNEYCAGEKKTKDQKCVKAYNRLADIFDLDPLDEGMVTTAVELLGLSASYKSRDRRETIEELKKDDASLDKLEEECKEKLDTKECKSKLLELSMVYDEPIAPTFFENVAKKIEECIKAAEKKAKEGDAAEGDAAQGGDQAQAQDATVDTSADPLANQ